MSFTKLPHRANASLKFKKLRLSSSNILNFFNAKHTEYVSPKIVNVVHKGALVSYGRSQLPIVIENL